VASGVTAVVISAFALVMLGALWFVFPLARRR
jgi:hypothetical protein